MSSWNPCYRTGGIEFSLLPTEPTPSTLTEDAKTILERGVAACQTPPPTMEEGNHVARRGRGQEGRPPKRQWTEEVTTT